MARRLKTRKHTKPSSVKVIVKRAQQKSPTLHSKRATRKASTMHPTTTESESSHTSSHRTATDPGRELTLRLYQERDIPRVLNMLMAAIPQLPNYAMITPNRDRILYVLEHNIMNAYAFAGWVLCDSHDVPQGCGAAWCVMSLIAEDLVADDVFMWVEPEYRSYKNAAMLVTAYVDWCKARGAKLIRASHTGGSFPKDSKEGKLYDALLRRLGFKEVGSVYHYSTYGDR